MKSKKICVELNGVDYLNYFDIVTRWNSTADMLPRAMVFKKTLKRMSEMLVETSNIEVEIQSRFD